jgi:prevent-host-death family protein
MNISILQVRAKLADTLNRVAYQGERAVLTRHGKGVAALVSMDDLALLEKLEDESDAKAARKSLAAIKAGKRKPIAWEQAKAELRARGIKR